MYTQMRIGRVTQQPCLFEVQNRPQDRALGDFGQEPETDFGRVVKGIACYIEIVMIFNHRTVRKQPVLGLFTPVQEIDKALGLVAGDSAAR